jgi:excisionase family DNA binding protein
MATTQSTLKIDVPPDMRDLAAKLAELDKRITELVAEAGGQVWYTRDEAATYLRMEVRTFDRYVRDGAVTKYNAAGIRAPRFRRDDLDALMQPVGPDEK